LTRTILSQVVESCADLARNLISVKRPGIVRPEYVANVHDVQLRLNFVSGLRQRLKGFGTFANAEKPEYAQQQVSWKIPTRFALPRAKSIPRI